MTDPNDHAEILQAAMQEALALPPCPLETRLHHLGSNARRLLHERSKPKARCARCAAEKPEEELGPGRNCIPCLKVLEQDGKLIIKD